LPVTRLAPAKPVGVPLDLRGGKDESEKRYIAPDGTVIEAPALSNFYADVPTWNAVEFRGYVGMVNEEGNQFIRAREVLYHFPQPKALTGVLVTPAYRHERKTEDFEPAIYDVFVDVSDDGGTTWKEMSKVLGVSPEEQGAAWLPLDAAPHQNLRVRIEPKSVTAQGIARIQLFQQR
jgi:hypothetical protein